MDELAYFIKRTDERLGAMEGKIDKLMESRALGSFFIAFGTSILVAIIQFFIVKRP